MQSATPASPYRQVPVLSKFSESVRNLADRLHTPDRYTQPYVEGQMVPRAEASPDEMLAAYPKVFGTVGATAGNVVGEVGGLVGGAIAGAAVGSLLGPAGTAGGAVLGLVAGFFGGKVALATVGGAIGLAVGKLFQKLHVQPPYRGETARDAQGFKLSQVPKHVANPMYTSHPMLTDADYEKIQKLVKPGDIIVSNNDFPDFEPVMQLLGVGGDWVHTSLYEGDGKVFEVHGKSPLDLHGSTARETTLKTYVTRNQHIMILRPQYHSEQEIQDVMAAARKRLGQKYDLTFNLNRPDKMYCVAYTYLSLKEGAPSLEIAEPSKRLGRDLVTPKTFQDSPDIKPVFSTGSHFSELYTSRVD